MRRNTSSVDGADRGDGDGTISADLGNLALLSVLLLLAFAATLALATLVLRTRGLSAEAPVPAALAMR